MAEKMIAFCGISCYDCPAFAATRDNDDSLREKVAKEWSLLFGFDLQKEDVNCDGCLSNARLIGHCDRCVIRACAMTKGLANCAHCDEYPCGELESFLESMPHDHAARMLRKIREGLAPNGH